MNSPDTHHEHEPSTSLRAKIIGIARHRMSTDGEGVTTLVAFHRCQLRCRYCLNPQSLGDGMIFREYTPKELYNATRVDELYFIATNGGVTFGGGEPCLRPQFIRRFRELCGDGWHITLETSLNAPTAAVEALLPVTNSFIIDIKDMLPDTYLRYTGQSNSLVTDNLRLIAENQRQADCTLRIPLIPDYNTDLDRNASRAALENLGFSQFDLFTYNTESLTMPRGRNTCRILKEIRRQIAEANDIRWITSECRYKSDCSGTCPKCEAEVRYLEQQLLARQRAGKAVALAGISAGMILLTGCTSSAQNLSADGSFRSDSLQGEPVALTDSIENVNYTPTQDAPGIEATNEVVEGKMEVSATDDHEHIFVVPEIYPKFPGGEKALLQFYSDNIRLPPMVGDIAPKGKIVVKFYVDTLGQVRDPQLVECLEPRLDKEVLRITELLPKFTPGQVNGHNVNVWVSFPLNFSSEGY